MDIFPEELKQQNDFDHFVKKTFPELKRRENLNPFEVAQLPLGKRTIRHLDVLKNWLRKVEFFAHFPDLILQRVCDCVVAENYRRGELIIKQGDVSAFMVIIFKGEIGVYINVEYRGPSQFDLLENTVKPLSVKYKTDILGEQGLLKAAKRGASCIAMADVQ